MLVVLSDVHANLEALDAVLADARERGARRIVCLGDLVGYGPGPIACVRRAMSWDVVLKGHTDETALAPDGFPGLASSPALKSSLVDFRRRLRWRWGRSAIVSFLASRPVSFASNDAYFVHATPRDALYEYLLPHDIDDGERLDSMAESFDQPVCFVGHSHIPGVFRRIERETWKFLTPESWTASDGLDGAKTIINVGSVGRPRDSDPRASYVLSGDGQVTFRRVAYDLDQTLAKIRRNRRLDNRLAELLAVGR